MLEFLKRLDSPLTDALLHAAVAAGLALGLFELGLSADASVATVWLLFLAREQRDVAGKRKRVNATLRQLRRFSPAVRGEAVPHEWKPWTWSRHTHGEHLSALVGAVLAVAVAL